MEDPIAYILAIFIPAAIVAFSKWRELSKERKLRELVSWSAIGDYCPTVGRYSYVHELLIAVLNAQHTASIDKKYRITEAEKQYVIEVIEAYQKDIMQSYFKGNIIKIKSKYAVDGEDYFMFALYVFLSDHQNDDKFLGHEMYSISTYVLTDFAVVVHKMHYITYVYCRRSEILRRLVPEWNEKNLKEILDANQIQVS